MLEKTKDGAGDAVAGDMANRTTTRVFEILERFRSVRRPMSVREIAEHFAYPLSSASVLLKSIAGTGYLSYDLQRRQYFPTVRLAALGEWVYESLMSEGDLPVLVDQVAQATEETVILAVQNDIYAQYVHVVPSKHPLTFQLAPGTKRLLCQSGAGWAIMSAQPDAEIARIVHRTLTRLGRKATGITERRVMNQINDAREKGYAVSRGTVTLGGGVIAMPLPVSGANARLAILVAAPIKRLDANAAGIVKALTAGLRKHGAKNGRG